MKIAARQLTTLIVEAKGDAPTKTFEDKLNTQTDAQLRGLIEMCEKILKERQRSADRSRLKTPFDVASYLIDVATGDEEHSDDKVDYAIKLLAALGKGAGANRIPELEELVGSMSNTAWTLFHDEFDDDEEALDAEAQQEKDYGKLQRLLSGFGLKFNKKGMLMR